MKPLFLVAILFCAGSVPAREGKDFVVRSQTGEFIVHGPRTFPNSILFPQSVGGGTGPVFLFKPTRDKESPDEVTIPLDPSLVAVACERVKQALLSTFGLGDDWSSPIHVFIEPGRQQGQVSLDTIRTGRGWLFRLALPAEMKELDLDRLILHAALLERSNRNPQAMANNVPKWLTEGLIRCLRASAPDGLSIQRIASFRIRPSPEIAFRELFLKRAPLSFEEMCWPEGLEPSKSPMFTASAELFVYELLRVRDGRACLAGMILKSPNYLNWQLAFLEAFQTHFRSLVEVEKWWSLSWVHLLGVDPSQRWASPEGWEKFEASLRTTVELRADRSSPPLRKSLTLQTAIRELPIGVQQSGLESTLFQLRVIQLHVPPRVAAIAREYQQILGDYLAEAARAGQTTFDKRQTPVNLNVLKQTVIGKLDLLDRKKAKLKAELQPLLESEALAR